MKREEAYKLVTEHTKNKNLVRHMVAVEAAMRALHAKIRGNGDENDESVEDWGLAGLLHDADYEEYKDNPEIHTHKTLEWLGGTDVSGEVKRTILTHGFGYVKDSPEPKTPMEWALYTCDELTGLIVAVALVKGGKLADVTVDSVMKKWKQKAFAAGANREQIAMCEEKLDIKLEEFIGIVLKAMQEIHEELGL